jgi:hypothetical protein
VPVEPNELSAGQRVPVMGEGERAQGFAKFDQPDPVALAYLRVSAQEVMRDKPTTGVTRRLERIDLILDVTCIQERADQLEPARGTCHFRTLVVALRHLAVQG